MKTLKKSFSVFLAMLMMFSVCCAGISSFALEDTPINRVDISLDTAIAGKYATDYEDFFKIETEHVTYDYSKGDPFYFQIDNDKYYEPVKLGETYGFNFFVVAEDGFYFDEDVEIYINGNLFSSTENNHGIYQNADGGCVLWVDTDQTIDGDPDTEVIDRIDITLNTYIAGKTDVDYKSIYTIDTEHITYNDKRESYPPLIIYKNYLPDGNSGVYTDPLQPGGNYYFEFLLLAEKGYSISKDAKIYVNGEVITDADDFSVYVDSFSGQNALKFVVNKDVDSKPTKLIDRVDISLKTDIAGKYYTQYEDFFTIETDHVNYDKANESSFYFQIDNENYYGPALPNETYKFNFYVVAESGYYFDEETEVYINGSLATTKDNQKVFINEDIYDYLNTYELCIGIEKTVDGEPITLIDRVDISLNTDIAGKTNSDYQDIYTVETEHVSYNNSVEGYQCFYFTDSEGRYDTTLKAGKLYTFGFNIAAEEGYYFDENTQIYINGALIEPDSFEAYHDGTSGLYTLNFETERVVDGSFLEKLITAITEFFSKLISFFNAFLNKPTPLNF